MQIRIYCDILYIHIFYIHFWSLWLMRGWTWHTTARRKTFCVLPGPKTRFTPQLADDPQLVKLLVNVVSMDPYGSIRFITIHNHPYMITFKDKSHLVVNCSKMISVSHSWCFRRYGTSCGGACRVRRNCWRLAVALTNLWAWKARKHRWKDMYIYIYIYTYNVIHYTYTYICICIYVYECMSGCLSVM